MRKLAIILLSTLFASLSAFGQICGIVMDAKERLPLEYVNIVLLSQKDSSFIAGTTTNSTGRFVLEKKVDGGILKISSIGYKTRMITSTGANDTIWLHRDEIMLDGIVVNSHKYIHTPQGIIANISNSQLSRLGNASDVLKHLPYISQKDGEYTVFGKGTPVIYVNNRLLRDKGELNQLNSSEIQKVEIITSPGAEYDATVNAVIRIFTIKKGKIFGGLFDAGISMERKLSDYGALSMNAGKGDFDFFATLRYDDDRSFQKQNDDFTYGNRFCKNSNEFSDKSLSLKGIAGVNLSHNDKLSTGLRYQYTRLPGNDRNSTEELSAFKNNVPCNFIAIKDYRESKSGSHYLNGYFSYNFTKDTYLKLDADYVKTGSDNKQHFSTIGGRVNTTSWSDNYLYAGRLLFATPLTGGVVKTGVEASCTNNTNEYDVLDDTDLPNALESSQNEARQQQYACFVQYERNFGAHWNAAVGGRFEYIDFSYFVHGVKDEASRRNHGFYPSASISYQTDELQLSLSYRFSTTRPSYFMLRNAVEYNSPYDYEGGSPDLKPLEKNMLSFSLSWKDLQFMTNYLSLRNATVYALDMYNGSDSVILFHTRNIDKIHIINSGIYYSPTWFKIWKPVFSVNFTKPFMTYSEQQYNKPICYFEFNNLIEIPRHFMIGCDMSYTTAGNADWDLSYQRSNYNLDVYCIKTVLNDRLRLKVSITNAFNTSREKWTKDVNGIKLNKWNDEGKRTFMLSISYNFNKIQNKYKGEYSTQEIYRL